LTLFLPLANGRFQDDPSAVAEIAAHQIQHTRAGAGKRAEGAMFRDLIQAP
jgi:hypothetical protein